MLAALVLVMLLATAPWWGTFIAVTWLNSGDEVSIEGFRHTAWDRVSVDKIEYTASGTQISVKDMKSPSVAGYLGFLLFKDSKARLVVDDLQVTLNEKEEMEELEESEVPGPHEIWGHVKSYGELLHKYLPTSEIRKIRVTTSDGGEVLALESDWNRETLRVAELVLHETRKLTNLKVTARQELVLQGQLHYDDQNWEVDMQFHRPEESDELNLTATARGNGDLNVESIWREDWIPDEVETTLEAFSPAPWLPDTEFSNWPESLGGTFSWDHGNWDISVSNSNDSSNFAVNLVANGERDYGNIEELNIAIPGMRMELSNPAEINLSERSLAEASTLEFEFQPHLLGVNMPLESGKGAVTLQPLRIWNLDAGIEIDGYLNVQPINPMISTLMSEFTGRLTPGEFALSGKLGEQKPLPHSLDVTLDLEDKKIREGILSLESLPESLQSMLPENVTFKSLTGELSASGPWANPQLSAEFIWESFQFGDIEAWDGALNLSGNRESFDYNLEGTLGSVFHVISGNAEFTEGRLALYLERADLGVGESEPWQLTERGNLTLEPGNISWRGWRWVDESENLRLASEGSLSLDGSGNISLETFEGNTRFIESIINVELPEVDWDRFESEIQYNETGSLTGNLTVSADIAPFGDDRQVRLDSNLELEPAGLRLDPLDIGEEGETVWSFNAQIPVEFRVNRDPWKIDWVLLQEPFRVNLAQSGRTAIADWLESKYGIAWQGLESNVSMEGDFESWNGEVNITAESLRLENLPEVPSIELQDLNLAGDIDETSWNIEFLKGQYNEHTFQTTFQLPFRTFQVTRTPEAGLAFSFPDKSAFQEALRNAHAGIQFEDFPVGEIKELIPGFPLETGQISADLGMEPEFRLVGEFSLNKGVSSPLGDGSRIQNINGAVRFEDDLATIQKLSFNFRNNPLEAQGRVQFLEWPNGLIKLSLQGKNIALVRQENAIIRSDIDISIDQDPDEDAVINGNFDLKDSIYVQDLRDMWMSQGGTTSPTRNPPWFSVEAEPFSNWELNVEISGEQFIRLQTPFFQGTATANLRLSQNLETPLLTGDILLPSGIVKFPFGKLKVEYGSISFGAYGSSAPQLNIVGSGRSFGHDIRMNVSGTADNPNIVFSSTPSLPTESILLMLTSGMIPSEDTAGTGAQKRNQQFAGFIGQNLISILFGQKPSEESIFDRIQIESGSGVSESGNETFTIRYELTDEFNLSAEYDEYDNYNVDLRWLFLEKE